MVVSPFGSFDVADSCLGFCWCSVLDEKRFVWDRRTCSLFTVDSCVWPHLVRQKLYHYFTGTGTGILIVDGADVFGIECCVSIALLVLAWYSTEVVFYVPERNIMHLTVQFSLDF